MRRLDPGPWEYGSPRHDADVQAYAAAMSQAFATAGDEIQAWVDRTGHEYVRVIVREGRAIGGLIEVPMGQFFGGRRLTMAGIAGVAVATEHRGSGGARALMTGALAEFRERGFAISALYASTARFYRGLGYERSGGLYEAEVAMHALPRTRSELVMRPADEDDHPAIETIHRERAQTQHGFADRGPYLWNRIRRPWGGQSSYGFVIEDGGDIGGYVYLGRSRRPGAIDVSVLDWGARTPAVFSRILQVIAGEFALAEKLTFKAGTPTDPWILSLAERQYQVRLVEHWMVRVLDLPAAFEGRGYFTHGSGTTELAVEDPQIPANHGHWTLAFEAGHCRVQRGGGGTIRCGARALAPLLTGGATPRDLALAGLLEGPTRAVDELGLLLAGPAPTMIDYF